MDTRPISEHVHLIDAIYRGESGVLASYLLKGERSIVVDPGPTVSTPYVIRGLERQSVSSDLLEYVAPTHIHLDHAGGSWKLLERYEEAGLLVHPRGAWHMVDPSKLESDARRLFGERVSDYGEIRGAPADRIAQSYDGQEIDLGGVTVRVVWTPGHAIHHQCYFVPEDGVVILGDAGGFHSPETGITMPTTPPPFNPQQAMESIDAIIALEPETACYGHFGSAGDAVEMLEAHREQIRLWSGIVEGCVEEDMSPDEVYERIRSEDPMASKVEQSPKMRERAPLVSVLGFLKYHEWARSKRRG